MGTPHNGLYGEAPPERGTFVKGQGFHKLRYVKGYFEKTRLMAVSLYLMNKIY